MLPDPAPVMVPFGGAEHDWAALELGAWIASATQAPLKLLGGRPDGRARVTRLLGDAGLLVQQYAGMQPEPVVSGPGDAGVVEAAAGAGLLIIGLSDRWRDEGSAHAVGDRPAAPAPALFVRRGERPGALAPREDVTRFTWSAPGVGALTGGGATSSATGPPSVAGSPAADPPGATDQVRRPGVGRLPPTDR